MRCWIGVGITSATTSLVALFLMSAPTSSPSTHGRYAEKPPLAHTGGFGEPTCQACHFDQPLNAEGGSLTLAGVPETFEPDQVYRLTLRLTRPDLGRGGFQLSVRDSAGAQAGTLEVSSDRATISTVDSTGVQYAHHTLEGTDLSAPDTTRWTLTWRAPDKGCDAIFHVSANAANHDASEFGDFVYTTQQRSNASDPQE